MNKVLFIFPGQLLPLGVILFALSIRSFAQHIDLNKLHPDYYKKYSPKELLLDLNFTINTLEDVHPQLYSNCSEQVFKTKLATTIFKLNKPLTKREFYLLIAPLISSLNDGHTGISAQDLPFYGYHEKNDGKLFPFDLGFVEDKVVITHAYSSAGSALIGKEVLSINSIPASKIKSDLLALEYGEREAFKLELIKSCIRLYLFTVYEFSNQFILKVRNGNSTDEQIYMLNGITSEELANYQIKKKVDIEKLKENYFYETFIKSQTGLLTFKACFDQGNFNKFLTETFNTIRNDNIKDLIIDVRQNIGGYAWLSQELLKYITNRPFKQIGEQVVKSSNFLKKDLGKDKYTSIYSVKAWKSDPGIIISIIGKPIYPSNSPNTFKGNIYILTGPKTFSSGMGFAMAVKDNRLGVIIGEETGGVASSSGEMYSVMLPNTKLRLNLATKFYVRPNGVIDGRGVLPDYEVKQMPGDTEKGVDTVLEFTQELIKGKLTE